MYHKNGVIRKRASELVERTTIRQSQHITVSMTVCCTYTVFCPDDGNVRKEIDIPQFRGVDYVQYSFEEQWMMAKNSLPSFLANECDSSRVKMESPLMAMI